MASDVALSLLTIGITSICWLAGFALARWRPGSRSTRPRKSIDSDEKIENSVESRLARMEADQASLFSTLEKLTTTLKRVSSRQGMRELREERADQDAPPPPGSPKHVVREYYRRKGVLRDGPQLSLVTEEPRE